MPLTRPAMSLKPGVISNPAGETLARSAPGNAAVQQQSEFAQRVSVVIPTYNEERFIRRCLEAVRSQKHYPAELVEIIVVDNGSTDGTVAICREFADIILNHPELRVGAMRNRGARAASGQWLAFLDADCVPDPEWLSSAAHCMGTELCVTGDAYDVPDPAHWIERAWFAQEQRGRRPSFNIPAGNLILSRDLFMQLGGFNEALITGEDAEFCRRAAQIVPIIADDRIRVVHLGNPKTIKKFLAREVWHGMGALGSVRLDWKDKPLIGTVILALLTVLQLVGLVTIAAGAGAQLFLFSTLGVLLLLGLTVAYRARAIRDLRSVPALFGLFYLYYMGRSASLLIMFARMEFRRREK